MARKRKITQTRVTALLPYSIELTKLKSGNTLDVQVRAGDELLGTLKMGRGSVQWNRLRFIGRRDGRGDRHGSQHRDRRCSQHLHESGGRVSDAGPAIGTI